MQLHNNYYGISRPTVAQVNNIIGKQEFWSNLLLIIVFKYVAHITSNRPISPIDLAQPTMYLSLC